MRADRWIGALGLLALIGAHEGTATAGIFELLDWACNQNDDARKGVGDREALATCHMTAGADKAACAVVTGEPFHCFEPQIYRGSQTCEYNDLVMTIKVSTQQKLGWKIEGVLVVDAGYKVDFEGDECRPSIRTTLDDTGTGTFVRRTGTAKLHTEFEASGEGYITFLGGKVFGSKYTAKCSGDASPKGYITDQKSGCKATCPPKLLGRSAAEVDTCLPDPSPSPTPDATPNPTPSPNPTPNPSPNPTPLPNPTPNPTPLPNPTANPTPVSSPTLPSSRRH
jgi:hypothetical protein